MYTKEEENLIVLSFIDELTSRIRCDLVSGRAGETYEEKEKFLVKTLPAGVYNIVREKFCDANFRSSALEKLKRDGIGCVTYLSDGYPENLKHTDCPPAALFYKGNASLLNTNCFSVVGSRKSTAAALAQCRKICGELTHAFTVVTGMADGADSAAAEGALDSGKIISVLANGFGYFYPAVNRGLIERVAQNGLLLSEYPPHIPPRKFNFPFRNRIIAGLSRGTLVVSAGETSGALITADYAAEYGRDVFAFPYSVGIASGVGCNTLIKNGAYLTENILDIFRAYGLDLEKSENYVKLTAEEEAVYKLIKAEGEAFLPAVAQSLKMFTYQLIPLISSLEIKKKIIRLGGNRYSAI